MHRRLVFSEIFLAIVHSHGILRTVEERDLACGVVSDEKEFHMSHPIIDADECVGCGICVDACPQEVLEVVGGVCEVTNEEACIACGDCLEECPMGAITEISED